MITETMTYQEIAKAFQDDWKDTLLRLYSDCCGARHELGRKVIKTAKPNEPMLLAKSEVELSNKNKYCFVYYVLGKRQYKKSGILRDLSLRYLRSDGIHVCKLDLQDTSKVTFYTPHFFDRIRERLFENDMELSKSDVINYYCFFVQSTYAQLFPHPKHKNSLFGVCDLGVLLGELIDENIIEYRTFITFDMLKGNQIDLSEEEIKVIIEARQKIINSSAAMLMI